MKIGTGLFALAASLSLMGCAGVAAPDSQSQESIETPAEIARQLASETPHVAQILRDHPEYLAVWEEEWWADALLRGQRIPGSSWRSHDLRRPQPPVVTPAFSECPSLPAPADASILLSPDVNDFAAFAEQGWSLQNGVLTSGGKKNNRLASKTAFGDVRLHLEFRMPDTEPLGVWQYRGNSGIFLMERYEVQILDSFNNPVYPDGAMAALYGQHPPLANASLPPGVWQCLDIAFRAPRFAAGEMVQPATASITLNGVTVQDSAQFFGPTGFGVIAPYSPHAKRLPFTLQDHGDATSKVSFRNIWAQPLGNDHDE